MTTLSAHAREGYSSHPVCLSYLFVCRSVCPICLSVGLSVCHTLILEIIDNYTVHIVVIMKTVCILVVCCCCFLLHMASKLLRGAQITLIQIQTPSDLD